VVPYFALDSLLPRDFTAGVTLRVTEILSSVDDLRVTAASSALNIPRHLTVAEIGAQLGVDYVLRGQIVRIDQTLYFKQWLYETARGDLLVEHEVECGLGQLTDFERDVLTRVTADVRLPLKENEIERIMRRRPRNASAYELALRAQVAMFRLDRRSFNIAKRLLLRAIEQDSGYATAYAWLARHYSLRIGQGWSTDRTADSREARRLADLALSLDARNAVALSTAGHLASYLDKDYDRGEKLLRRAVRCAPNEPLGHLMLGATLAYTGRPREGRRSVEHALTLSPLDAQAYVFFNFAAVCCYAEGDYDGAVRYARRSEALNPAYSTTLKLLAASLVGLGEVATAREVVTRLVRLEPSYDLAVARRMTPFLDDVLREQYLLQMRTAGCFDAQRVRQRRSARA
jgi:adenylate cyclase